MRGVASRRGVYQQALTIIGTEISYANARNGEIEETFCASASHCPPQVVSVPPERVGTGKAA
jgi:hypothetical protein